MATESENAREYAKMEKRRRAPFAKGAISTVGWSLTGIFGTLAAIVFTPLTLGAFPLVALAAIGLAVARGIGKTASAISARTQLKQVGADLEADGEKITPEKMGERLRDEPRGLFSGLKRAVKEAISPAKVRGEEKPRMRDFAHRHVDRIHGMKGLEALGVSAGLTTDMQKFLAERIKFEKDGRGRIDPMRFTLRLSAKEMNGEGLPPGVSGAELQDALKKLQTQHYRNFAEAYLPNHLAHRMEQLEELKQLEQDKERGYSVDTDRLEELKAEVSSWGPKGRKEAEDLASTLAKSYEKQFGKAEAPDIGYHNGQNSVTFKPNTLQSHAANAMLSKAGQKPDIDDDRLRGMRDVYANGKAHDGGKGEANGPDAGSGKKPAQANSRS